MGTLGTLRPPEGATGHHRCGPLLTGFCTTRGVPQFTKPLHLFFQYQCGLGRGRNSVLGFLFLPGGTGAPLRVHQDPGQGLQSLW